MAHNTIPDICILCTLSRRGHRALGGGCIWWAAAAGLMCITVVVISRHDAQLVLLSVGRSSQAALQHKQGLHKQDKGSRKQFQLFRQRATSI